MLKFQKLDRFFKLTGNTYPDLVKVFLTNIWYDEENLYSQVKGIDIAINEEVWLSITGLRNEGATVSRGNTSELGNFNKVQFYKSCLRNQESASRTYNVGGLAATPRILAYIVIWYWPPVASTMQHWLRRILYSCVASWIRSKSTGLIWFVSIFWK